MSKYQPFSRKIATVFVSIAAALLFFYTIVVEAVVHHAENLNSQQRLTLIAPHHLSLFDNNELEQVIQTDPITTIYSHYHLLPSVIQDYIKPDWSGVLHIIEEEAVESSVFAQQNTQGRMVYAVEDVAEIEWADFDFLMVEIALFVFGVLLFLLSAWVIINIARRISSPFTDLANQLQSETSEQLSPIVVQGELSQELMQTLQGINYFRARIKEALIREQSFTRYVSHELRTPMTVIKGSLSLLRRNRDPNIAKQVARIEHAMEEMEQLTQTFLLLARDEDESYSSTVIDQAFLNRIQNNISKRIQSNNVNFQTHLPEPLTINAEPILVTSLISNLLLNAINCSIDGDVTLKVTAQYIQVIDNGVGLNKKDRGYEGFGIGLNVVKDICHKYQWQFSLTNNKTQGCTALVTFYNGQEN